MIRYNVPYRVQFISTEGIIRPISKMVIILLHFFRFFFLFVTSQWLHRTKHCKHSYLPIKIHVLQNLLNDITEASSLTRMRRSEERSTRTEERSKGWLGCATDRHGVQFWTTVGQIFQFIEQFFDFHFCAFNKSS